MGPLTEPCGGPAFRWRLHPPSGADSERRSRWSQVCFLCTAPPTGAPPVRPIIPLVARISDQNASGAPPMAGRDKSRLDKFKLLLASPSADLGELASLPVLAGLLLQVVGFHTHLAQVFPGAHLQQTLRC